MRPDDPGSTLTSADFAQRAGAHVARVKEHIAGVRRMILAGQRHRLEFARARQLWDRDRS
jgi:hypothetical protein